MAANSWLSNPPNLNKNTEAIARAIWAQVQKGYVKQKGTLIGLNKLKKVQNLIIKGTHYKPNQYRAAEAATAKNQAAANAALLKARKAIAKSVYNKVPLKNTNILGTKTPKSNNHAKIISNIEKIRNSNTNFNTYINAAINSIQKNNTGFGVGRFAKRNANFEYRKKLAKRIVQSLKNETNITNWTVQLDRPFKLAQPASTSQPPAGLAPALSRVNSLLKVPTSFWETNAGRALNSKNFKNILKKTTNKKKRFQFGFGPKTITPSNAQYQSLRLKKGNKKYGNIPVWNSSQLANNINKTKNLTNLQKNALRRMIRSVKLNKKYPGQTRNSSGNIMELTNDLMNIKNNAALKNALVKKIAEQAARNEAARRPSTVRNNIPNTYNSSEQLPTYKNHLRNYGN